MKMDKSSLLEVIGDSMENRILDFFIEGKGISYTKTDISDACEISRPMVYKILPRLVSAGIIKPSKSVGRVQLYTLNPKNEKAMILLKLEEILLKKSFDALDESAKLRTPVRARVHAHA